MENNKKAEVCTLPIEGPQHQTISYKMAETYGNLFTEIKKAYPAVNLSRFFPMEGENYREFKQLSRITPMEDEDLHMSEDEFVSKYMEPAVRLMVVGRCPNGWYELKENTREEFKLHAACSIIESGFHWLHDNGHAVDTYIRQSDGKECTYNINRSAFWRSIKNIVQYLKPVTNVVPRWFEHIVWTNLYPIAPRDAGNAGKKMKLAQLKFCRDLLVQQVEHFIPTHILFITDWEEWFDAFSDLFPGVARIGNSVTDNVVGKGFYEHSKVVVTIRPDRTRPNKPDEAQFAEDVYRAFVL